MKKFLVAILAAITCISFAACAPSNIDKAKEKMEEAGYKVETTTDAATVEAIAGEGAVGMIYAVEVSVSLTTGVDGGMISAVLFDSKSAAKDYYEKVKDEEAEDEDQIVKQDGKWVYAGTESAIEDFTK